MLGDVSTLDPLLGLVVAKNTLESPLARGFGTE